MSLLVLIPLSIGMGLVGLGAFIWALRHDQFDDLAGNAERVLIPDQQVKDAGHSNDDPASER